MTKSAVNASRSAHGLIKDLFHVNRVRGFTIISITIVFGMALLYLSLREDMWGDEGFTVRRVEASWNQLYYPFACRPPDNTDPFDKKYVYDFNPPLYFAVIRLYAGANPSRFQLRLLSIIAMMGSLFMLALLTRRLYGMNVGIAMMILFCLSPSVIYYGHEARPYALGVMFSFVLVACALRKGSRSLREFFICAGISMISLLIHYHMAWIILCLMVCSTQSALRIKERKQLSCARVLGFASGSALALLIVYPAWESFSWTQSQNVMHVGVRSILSVLTLPFNQGYFSVTDSSVYASICLILVGILTVRFAMSMRGRMDGALGRGIFLLFLWVFTALAPIAAHLITGTPYYERYALFSLPGWYLFHGGLFRNSCAGGPFDKALMIIYFSLLLLQSASWCIMTLPEPMRPVWKPAIQDLLDHEIAGDYYSVQPDWLRFGLVANAVKKPISAYDSLASGIPADATRIWIMGPKYNEPAILEKFSNWNIKPVSSTDDISLWRMERPPSNFAQ